MFKEQLIITTRKYIIGHKIGINLEHYWIFFKNLFEIGWYVLARGLKVYSVWYVSCMYYVLVRDPVKERYYICHA